MTEAAEDADNSPVDFSFASNLALIRDAVASMIQTTPARLAATYQRLLDDIRQTPIRKRPGRSVPGGRGP